MGFDFVDDDQAVEPETNSYVRRPIYPKRSKQHYPVSIGTWIGIFLIHGALGFIPYIGKFLVLIFLIVLSLADVNQSIKNFARAALIIGLIAFFILLSISGIANIFRPFLIFQI